MSEKINKNLFSEDVGKAAGKEILNRIFDLPSISSNISVPRFTQPIVESCKMPGGLNFTSIRAPTRDALPDAHKQNLQRWLKTKTEDCISRIHLSPFGKVDGLIFISKQTLPVENLIRLYGLHERYLFYSFIYWRP